MTEKLKKAKSSASAAAASAAAVVSADTAADHSECERRTEELENRVAELTEELDQARELSSPHDIAAVADIKVSVIALTYCLIQYPQSLMYFNFNSFEKTGCSSYGAVVIGLQTEWWWVLDVCESVGLGVNTQTRAFHYTERQTESADNMNDFMSSIK